MVETEEKKYKYIIEINVAASQGYLIPIPIDEIPVENEKTEGKEQSKKLKYFEWDEGKEQLQKFFTDLHNSFLKRAKQWKKTEEKDYLNMVFKEKSKTSKEQ